MTKFEPSAHAKLISNRSEIKKMKMNEKGYWNANGCKKNNIRPIKKNDFK